MARSREKSAKISYSDTYSFFEGQAQGAKDDFGKYLAVTVFSDAETADKRHKAELEVVLPLLALDSESRVVEIGCGAGRWAHTVTADIRPLVEKYVGVDFSPSLIEIAREKHKSLSNAEFHVMAADALNVEVLSAGAKFSHGIVVALLLYLNDDSVSKLVSDLGELIRPGGKLYIREPICTEEQRLALIGEYSESIQKTYNAVYRTHAEYVELIERTGRFRVVTSGVMPDPLFKKYKETCHKYYLVDRV